MKKHPSHTAYILSTVNREDGSGEKRVMHPKECKVSHCVCKGKGGEVWTTWSPTVIKGGLDVYTALSTRSTTKSTA